MTKVLLLDKDGTLISPASGAKFVNQPDDQAALPGVREALNHYISLDWTPIIISNQGGVAAGHKSLDDAIAEMRFAMSLFPEIEQAYFCPCDIKSEGDHCWHVTPSSARAIDWRLTELYNSGFRKPHPGMLQLAIAGYKVDEVLMVGDRPEDERAAAAAKVPFMWADQWRLSNAA